MKVTPSKEDGTTKIVRNRLVEYSESSRQDRIVRILDAIGKKGMLGILILFSAVYFIFGVIMQQSQIDQ